MNNKQSSNSLVIFISKILEKELNYEAFLIISNLQLLLELLKVNSLENSFKESINK